MFVLEMEPVTALFSNPSNQLSDDPVFFAMLHGWPALKKARCDPSLACLSHAMVFSMCGAHDNSRDLLLRRGSNNECLDTNITVTQSR